MKAIISKQISEIYDKSHKNFDYALSTLLASLDPKCFKEVLNSVSQFSITSDSIEIELGDPVSKELEIVIPEACSNKKLLELLIFIAALFPEI